MGEDIALNFTGPSRGKRSADKCLRKPWSGIMLRPDPKLCYQAEASSLVGVTAHQAQSSCLLHAQRDLRKAVCPQTLLSVAL